MKIIREVKLVLLGVFLWSAAVIALHFLNGLMQGIGLENVRLNIYEMISVIIFWNWLDRKLK